MKSKSTATILAFFLGGLGIHRFYLGQGGLGILYLLFCWTFIPSFLAFIDFIMLLVMDQRTFDYKYNPAHYGLNMQQHSMAMNMNASPNMTTTVQNNTQAKISTTKEIQRLYELKQTGAITETEYEIQKARILNLPYNPTPNPQQQPPAQLPPDNVPPRKEPPQIGLSPEDAW